MRPTLKKAEVWIWFGLPTGGMWLLTAYQWLYVSISNPAFWFLTSVGVTVISVVMTVGTRKELLIASITKTVPKKGSKNTALFLAVMVAVVGAGCVSVPSPGIAAFDETLAAGDIVFDHQYEETYVVGHNRSSPDGIFSAAFRSSHWVTGRVEISTEMEKVMGAGDPGWCDEIRRLFTASPRRPLK